MTINFSDAKKAVRRSTRSANHAIDVAHDVSQRKLVQARHAGWAGIALGFVAWFITLPPVLVRTPVPSILIGLLAMTAGGWAIGGDEKRLGWGAIVAGLVDGIGQQPSNVPPPTVDRGPVHTRASRYCLDSEAVVAVGGQFLPHGG